MEPEDRKLVEEDGAECATVTTGIPADPPIRLDKLSRNVVELVSVLLVQSLEYSKQELNSM